MPGARDAVLPPAPPANVFDERDAGDLLALLPPRWQRLHRGGGGRSRTRDRLRFSALDLERGDVVFVKLDRDGATLRREADLIARIDHPSVVRVRAHDTGPDGGWLVLERVPGQTLEAALLRTGRIEGVALAALLAAIARGVQAIHDAGVVHRDLKPANVVIRPDGTPVIVDFDRAASLDDAARGRCPAWLTPGYAAPEQAWTDAAEGPWTDVYALAAIGWRALTGTPPGPEPATARDAPPLAQVLAGALSRDPGRRPPTADRFARDVLAAGESGTSAATARIAADEDGPPTIPVDRQPSPTEPPPPPAGRPGGDERPRRERARGAGWRRLLWVMVPLAALVGLLAWHGPPLYERHLKDEWIVDATGAGDVATIGEAIARARDGATLRVRPGSYPESLVLDRPLTLAAADPSSPPVVSPSEGPCLSVRGDGAAVLGFDFRAADPATAGGDAPACVVVTGGNALLEDNRMQGTGGPAVLLRDGARPTLLRNGIRGSGAGIVVTSGAAGLLSDNTLIETGGPAIVVRGGATPGIARNVIENGGGVVYAEGAGGTLRGNRIAGARGSAVELRTGADPTIEGNAIERPAQSGVFVYEDGRGRIEGNTITGSGLSGIVVAQGGAPVLKGNTIVDAGEHGILVVGASGGVIETNTVRNSRRNGIVVGADAGIEVKTNTLQGNVPPQQVDLRRR